MPFFFFSLTPPSQVSSQAALVLELLDKYVQRANEGACLLPGQLTLLCWGAQRLPRSAFSGSRGVQEGTDPHGSSQLLTAPHGFWGLPGAAGGTSPCLSLLSSASTQQPAARPHFLSPFQNHHGDVKAQITARMLWLVGSTVSGTGWGAGGGLGVPGAGAVLPRPFPARAGTARCVAASK